jgi:hypothetical protein
MAYTDLTDLDHDKDLANALGNMVIVWAYAETALSAVLARVTGININMAIMGYYRIPTFEARTKFLQALISEWTTAEYDKPAISKEVDRLMGNSAARNDWVHGVWCHDKAQSETVVFDYRRHEEKGRRKPVKAADVRNHIEAVRKHAKELMRLVRRGEMWGDA